MITVLMGDDRERLLRELDTSLAASRTAGYTTLDAENLTAAEVLEPLMTVSLFGDSGTYLVKDADKNPGFLMELEKSVGKLASGAGEHANGHSADNPDVYLQFEKLAKTTRLYKLLARTKGVRIVEYKKFVDTSASFNIVPAALTGNRREALALLKKSQLAGNEPIAVLGAMNYKLAQVLEDAHRRRAKNLPELQTIGKKFLNAREVLLAGVIDPWLYLATLLTETAVIS
ncbi:hypothetical protein FWG76_03065 [Candidatus Saccharibacteria bacterium]|nr:hypothetical protein [Candidatus Saccharibacteria bacterium]